MDSQSGHYDNPAEIRVEREQDGVDVDAADDNQVLETARSSVYLRLFSRVLQVIRKKIYLLL